MPFVRRLYEYRILLLLWLMVIVVGFVGAWFQFWHTLAVVAPTPESWEKPLAAAPIRQYTLATTEAKPRLSAHSVWIYDRKTKETLLEQEAQVATAPASLVKLMTALVAFERFDLDQPVTIGSAAGVLGNRAKFLPQDQFVVRDLLTTMLMFSANDAGEALAQATASPTSFIEDMNFKADQFGLEHTHFTNVTGLDDPAQFSTAQDLGRLADQLLTNPFLAETVSQEIATVRELRTGRIDTIYTTNSLLRRGPEFQGIKTGTTDLAGQNLIFRYKNTWDIAYEASPSASQPRELDLLVVILGSQDRYADALLLTNWLQRSLRIAENSVR